MSRRFPKILSIDELEKLSTSRLLSYRDRLYKVPETAYYDQEALCTGRNQGQYLHKESPQWRAAMAAVKSVLESREHVDRTQK